MEEDERRAAVWAVQLARSACTGRACRATLPTEDCDFSRALLRGADLRASNFDRCRFDGADLAGADLRGSSFGDCSFLGARMEGAHVTEEQAQRLPLDPSQRKTVSVEDKGEEPPGG